jgi:hypothetical protein
MYGYVTNLPTDQSRSYLGTYDNTAPPTPSPIGGTNLRITTSSEGTLFSNYTIPITLAPTERLVISWYYYAQNFITFGGGNNMTITQYNAETGAYISGSQVVFISTNDTWSRNSAIITNNSSSNVIVKIASAAGGSSQQGAGSYYWLDGFQIESGSSATTFIKNKPVYPDIKADTAHIGESKSFDVSKAADGAARTKLTEFTPINFTQDYLDVIAPDL